MQRELSLTPDLVALCERDIDDPGPIEPYPRFDEKDFRAVAEGIVATRPPGPLWLFAYGSLIWKPDFEAVERRRAHARGWHRAFSLEIVRWRGSVERPGLMLALERGGSCAGVAYRLPDDDHVGQVERLLVREVDGPDQLSGVRWISLRCGTERLRALSFWTGASGLSYVSKRPLPEVAKMLAGACGHLGSGAAYLYNTVSHLEALGIRDRTLWQLQAMVADEIRRRHTL